MSNNTKLLKVILDMLMLVLIVFEMCTHSIGQPVHTITGLILFILFIVHNIVEFKWYKSIFKGQINTIKFLSILINIALLINMIIMMITAFFLPQFMSKYVSYSVINGAKEVHKIAGSWLFVIISIHLSLHPATAVHPAKKQTDTRSKSSKDYIMDFVKYAVLILITAYGIKAFIDNDLALKLINGSSLNQYKTNTSIIKLLADYTCIMIVISYVSYKILKFIKRVSAQK